MYGNAADARVYWNARGFVVPVDWTDADVDSALQVASEWLDGKYETSFSGLRAAGRDQERAWPRTGAHDREGYSLPDNEIPREIVAAIYQAAFRHLTTPGQLSVDFTPAKYKSARVEGAVAVEYATYTYAADVQTQFAVIDAILAPILTGGGSGSSLSGDVARA